MSKLRHFYAVANLSRPLYQRGIRQSVPHQNSLIVGGIGLLASAVACQYVYQAYLNLPSDPKNVTNESEPEPKSSDTTSKSSNVNNQSTQSSFASSWFAKKFYDGGFEDKMTKREAALILGVRESASAERVKEAHRRILLLNHPDRGGSAFIAAKINEAKDLLIKGK